MVRGLLLAALLALGALQAHAQPAVPLREHAEINSRLVYGRVADLIRKTCPQIEARKLRAWSELEALKGLAQSAGYSQSEITAFVESRAERERITASARQILARRGAPEGDVAAHCRLGRSEIARDSFVGRLLIDRG